MAHHTVQRVENRWVVQANVSAPLASLYADIGGVRDGLEDEVAARQETDTEVAAVRVIAETAITPAELDERVIEVASSTDAGLSALNSALSADISAEATARADADTAEASARTAADNLKADKAQTIIGAGLASGGGSLASDRTITVPASSGIQALDALGDDTAMTPASVETVLDPVRTVAQEADAPLVALYPGEVRRTAAVGVDDDGYAPLWVGEDGLTRLDMAPESLQPVIDASFQSIETPFIAEAPGQGRVTGAVGVDDDGYAALQTYEDGKFYGRPVERPPVGASYILRTRGTACPVLLGTTALHHPEVVKAQLAETLEKLTAQDRLKQAAQKARLKPTPSAPLPAGSHMSAAMRAKLEAEGLTGGEKQVFLAKHLNIEIGLALSNNRWAGAEYWEAAGDKTLTLDSLLERSEVCTVGIDGGGLDDLFGLAVLGREKVTRKWLLWTHAWAHDDVLKRRADIATRLRDFERDRDLTISTDPMEPIDQAAGIVERVKDAGLLPEENAVGLDPAGVASLVDELEARGIGVGMQVAVRQGFALSPASWGSEIKLKNGSLVHGARPLMAWCVGNAKVEVRGGAVVITKQSAGRAKIDPLVASFNAIMLMARNPEAQGPSVYETRGLLMV